MGGEARARGKAEGGAVFVTVGTTRFDALIREVSGEECQRELRRRGYSRLRLQKGKGTFTPAQVAEAEAGSDGLAVEVFDFSPSLVAYMNEADLVISHAGSGSIFEALRLQKPLVVVVNEDLMDNHQQELAQALAEQHHLVCATPATLAGALRSMDLASLRPYPPPEAHKFAAHLYKFLGFA